MKEIFTITDVLQARDEEKERIRIILEYICNKNSRPLPESVDYKNFFNEIQELEESLID